MTINADSVEALLRAFDRNDGAGLGAPSLRQLVRRLRARLAERETELAEATARNLCSFCCWCGQLQKHPSLEARTEAVIGHTIACPERPEPQLLACMEDLLSALRVARDALRDLAGSPAEFDDDRCGCVAVQVDRGDLVNARVVVARADALLARLDASTPATVAEHRVDSGDNSGRP